ncbi:hypothetical protein [Bdellovibrio sp. HCB2-146]|uniref:hypothetical protein n=1 Tax=Bdellovibrio sp. HCB2-146 TaxID=3394362 RepID=UPI0039BC2F95
MEIQKCKNSFAVILVLSLCLGLLFSPKLFAEEIPLETDLVWDVREWEFLETVTKPSYELSDEHMIRKAGHSYTLRADLIPQEARALYYELDLEKREKFHKIRLGLLNKFAAVLDKNALMMGAAIVTKNKILGIFKKGQKAEGSLREIGRTSVENVLNGLNAKLWNEARKVADAKEVSLVVNPAAGVFIGVPNKLHIGGAIGFGLNIGYNVESDVLFLTINGTVEKIKSGFVIFGGAKLLTGLQFDSNPAPGFRFGKKMRQKSNLFLRERSEIYNPIYVPFWTASGEGRYGLGISASFSVPGQVFYYKNDSLSLRLLRLDLPTEGFWRVVFDGLAKLGASDHILMQFAKRAHADFVPKSCGGLFL